MDDHRLTKTDQLALVQQLCDQFGWGAITAVPSCRVTANSAENRLKFNALVPVRVIEVALVVDTQTGIHQGRGEWFYWIRDQEWELSEFKEES